MKTPLIAAALIAALAGCDRAELPLAQASKAEPGAAIDPRSPRDLADALAAVERGDPAEAADGYARVVRRFQGRRYRWPLYLVPPLCRRGRCNVLAFDHIGREHGVVQGWMPRLEIDEEQRRLLLERCGERSPCPFVAEVRLAALTASPERFTSVALADVELDAASIGGSPAAP